MKNNKFYIGVISKIFIFILVYYGYSSAYHCIFGECTVIVQFAIIGVPRDLLLKIYAAIKKCSDLKSRAVSLKFQVMDEPNMTVYIERIDRVLFELKDVQFMLGEVMERKKELTSRDMRDLFVEEISDVICDQLERLKDCRTEIIKIEKEISRCST